MRPSQPRRRNYTRPSGTYGRLRRQRSGSVAAAPEWRSSRLSKTTGTAFTMRATRTRRATPERPRFGRGSGTIRPPSLSQGVPGVRGAQPPPPSVRVHRCLPPVRSVGLRPRVNRQKIDVGGVVGFMIFDAITPSAVERYILAKSAATRCTPRREHQISATNGNGFAGQLSRSPGSLLQPREKVFLA